MKKAIGIIVFGLLWCNVANARLMIPLKTYVKNNNAYE